MDLWGQSMQILWKPLLSTPGSSTEWKKKKCSPLFHSSFRLPETFGYFKYQGRISTRLLSTSKLQLISEHLLIKNWDLSRKDILYPKTWRRNPNLKTVEGAHLWCIQIPNLLSGQSTNWRMFLDHRSSPTGLRALTLIPGFQPRHSAPGGGAPRRVHLEDLWGLILGATYDGGNRDFILRRFIQDLACTETHNKRSGFTGAWLRPAYWS